MPQLRIHCLYVCYLEALILRIKNYSKWFLFSVCKTSCLNLREGQKLGAFDKAVLSEISDLKGQIERALY